MCEGTGGKTIAVSHKKNNGELPQYYIRDNHPAILTREEFAQIQEELARRRSKRPANAKSKEAYKDENAQLKKRIKELEKALSFSKLET